eukprot:COSAG01_NODE_6519_length_3624_cov_2.070355_1_plen_293_part_00
MCVDAVPCCVDGWAEPCPAGTVDTDSLSSTACDKCNIGKASAHLGSTNDNHCEDCAAGRWSTLNGSGHCALCPPTMHRRIGQWGCQPCKLDRGERCDVPGMVAPLAAPGFYAADKSDGDTAIVQCIPFQACVGTCPAELVDQLLNANEDDPVPEKLNFENCPAGLEQQSCAEGYTGPKCAVCVPVDSSKDCNDASTTTLEKGFYRLDQRCEPCPCSWFGFKSMIATAVVLMFFTLVIMDKLYSTSEEAASYFSTKSAPFVIMLTFAQTLGKFHLLYSPCELQHIGLSAPIVT